jgi:hypothetical protein
MASIESYISRAEAAETEIQNLLKELNELENSSGSSGSSENVEKLRIENTKLKYRLGILQNAVKVEEMRAGGSTQSLKLDFDLTSTMPSLLQLLTDIFKSAVSAAFPELGSGEIMSNGKTSIIFISKNDCILDIPCPLTLSAKQADYQFNGAMIISGMLKVCWTDFISCRGSL